MDKSGKKVSVNVLQVMGNNFLSDNFVLRSLIGPQLASWIIGQNLKIEFLFGICRAFRPSKGHNSAIFWELWPQTIPSPCFRPSSTITEQKLNLQNFDQLSN
jgi:hypothetical protein